MGAWLSRVPTTTPESFRQRRVVYLGHLVPRQGVEKLIDAIAELASRGEQIAADIVGTGPLETDLREHARELGLADDVVHFHGFVADHRDVEVILAEASIAVAPVPADPRDIHALRGSREVEVVPCCRPADRAHRRSA